MNPDLLLENYDYPLPEHLVAQFPPKERGLSRLMVLDTKKSGTAHVSFVDIGDFIPEGALLVANNTRVAPARILGNRTTGGKWEMLLLTPPPLLEKNSREQDGWNRADAVVLLKPGKYAKSGGEYEFGSDIRIQVVNKEEFGRHAVVFFWRGILKNVLEKNGQIPLPPYIKREEEAADLFRYQTVYAREDKAGSVAAPTAGLHFTPEIRDTLEKNGVTWKEVTLHVGYGTFSPVREENIQQHVMHAEYVEIPTDTAVAVAEAKRSGRPVIAVGTTSARCLEGAWRAGQGELSPAGFAGWTNIFLYPGCLFGIVDGMITNFHLPKSSLLMLVSALTGRERLLDAYAEAIKQRYRFFSYGDAMLIL